MIREVLSLYFDEKEVYIPTLGKTNCEGLYNLGEKCNSFFEENNINKNECIKLNSLSIKCYFQNKENITEYIEKEVNERKELNEFLSKNNSQLFNKKLNNNIIDIFDTELYEKNMLLGEKNKNEDQNQNIIDDNKYSKFF